MNRGRAIVARLQLGGFKLTTMERWAWCPECAKLASYPSTMLRASHHDTPRYYLYLECCCGYAGLAWYLFDGTVDRALPQLGYRAIDPPERYEDYPNTPGRVIGLIPEERL